MSSKIVSNELTVLLNISPIYQSIKTDKYVHEIAYFAIENVDVDTFVKDIT